MRPVGLPPCASPSPALRALWISAYAQGQYYTRSALESDEDDASMAPIRLNGRRMFAMPGDAANPGLNDSLDH